MTMRRFLVLVAVLLSSAAPSLSAAQLSQIDGAFSDQLIRELGYPRVEVSVGPDGIEAPSELPPGYYHMRLSAAEGFVGYMNIVQPPAGLDAQDEEEQMLTAGASDLPQPGWTYLGGTNTPELGETASFVVQLGEGEYKIAASYYGETQDVEEVMRLAPLSVRAGAAPVAGTPEASPFARRVMSAPEEDVTLEMTDDLRYIVTPETISAGPHIWRFENTGTERSHHIVMFRLPKSATGDDIAAEFGKMMGGEAPADDSLVSQMVWIGYGAMQSGGTVTWSEFDLTPGTYAVVCFIMDDENSAPHLMDGMVTTFVVE